jgi:hypothetical protein
MPGRMLGVVLRRAQRRRVRDVQGLPPRADPARSRAYLRARPDGYGRRQARRVPVHRLHVRRSSALWTQSLNAPVLQGITRVHHPHRGQAGEEGVREGGQPARAALGADVHRPRHRAGACLALSAPRDSPAERTQVLPYLFDHPVERVTDTVFEVGLPPRKPCDCAHALIVGRREGRRGGGAQEGALRRLRRVQCCTSSLEVDVMSVMRDLLSRSRRSVRRREQCGSIICRDGYTGSARRLLLGLDVLGPHVLPLFLCARSARRHTGEACRRTRTPLFQRSQKVVTPTSNATPNTKAPPKMPPTYTPAAG